MAFSAGVHAGDEIPVGSVGAVGECAGGVVCAAHKHGSEEVESPVAGSGEQAEFGWWLKLVPDRDGDFLLESALGDNFHGGEKLLRAGDGKPEVCILFEEGFAGAGIDHNGAARPYGRGG